MNIGRGLFRAWILVSALWIAGAVYLFITQIVGAQYAPIVLVKKGATPELYTKVIDEPNSPDFYAYFRSPAGENLEMEFTAVDKPPADPNAFINFPDGTKLYVPKGYSTTDKNYIAEQYWQQRWSRWAYTGWPFVRWALVPCVALFIIGYALLWVGRGFKHA
jgi:hypothetical protein